MKVSTNEGARSIAYAFEFLAKAQMRLANDGEKCPGTDTAEGAYYMARGSFEQAGKWYDAARGMTIGHNRSARYDDAAKACKEKAAMCLRFHETVKAFRESK